MACLLDVSIPFHRGLALSALPDTAQRIRPTLISDGQGGETTGTPDTSLSFACRLSSRRVTPREQEQAGRVTALMQWVLEVPHGTDLLPTDQVRVNGGLFEVIDDNDKGSAAVIMTVNLREIR